MIQRGGRQGLAAQSLNPAWLRSHGGRKQLDRDESLQIAVSRKPDLAHASDAEATDDLELVQARAGTQLHRGNISAARSRQIALSFRTLSSVRGKTRHERSLAGSHMAMRLCSPWPSLLP
jgi:hypothetical protein